MPDVATLVSVAAYLASNRKPNCDYLDGVLIERPMHTWKHSRIQFRIIQLIEAQFPGFVGGPELTVQIRPGKFLVPDVVILAVGSVQSPYPTEPVHLCVEVMSPDDRLSAVLSKCEDYHAWGMKTAWVIDPERRRAWVYNAGQLPDEVAPDGCLTADPIEIPLADLLSIL